LLTTGPEEVHALVRASGDEQDGALFLTAAMTGLRMGELFGAAPPLHVSMTTLMESMTCTDTIERASSRLPRVSSRLCE
jgi:hypothetical protein